MTRGVVCHQNFVRCAQRLAIGPERADHDADPSDHDGDLGDHDGDPGDHDGPILAIMMGRSERSRSAETRNKSGSHFQEDEVESPSEAALRELDAWDEVGFHQAHAALVRTFPTQADFIFADLVPHQGADAILGIVQFLDRLDVLDRGRSESTKDADAAAMKELADRGIGTSERARLRALIQIAQSSPSTLVDEPAGPVTDERTQDLYALYCWYQRWVEIARVVIKNRKAAVTLGIAHRRPRVEVGAPTTGPGATAPGAAQASTAAAPAVTPTA